MNTNQFNTVKRGSLALALLASLVAITGLASAQEPTVTAVSASKGNVRIKGGEVDLRAKVVELDIAQRTVVLRNSKGKLVHVDVPASVENFDQVHVGDELLIRYAAAVAVALEPTAQTTGIRERVVTDTQGSGSAGGLPSTSAGRKIELLAVVEGVDRKARVVTLRGVKRTLEVTAPDNVDLAKIKVGQEVRAVFVEAAAVSVVRRAKSK
ncbi:hypothetical protein [Roseateles koreensis]|uniref:Uncharacterized protein n=1 Tax=Roseateles koreensis TaxID=2987526 RepID=A0ABT5KQT6_9BURK|nr:hypothetical protein [Roseateles koreensis]MDC8785263.1 hypothetical protein [Roseateles koreensis]